MDALGDALLTVLTDPDLGQRVSYRRAGVEEPPRLVRAVPYTPGVPVAEAGGVYVESGAQEYLVWAADLAAPPARGDRITDGQGRRYQVTGDRYDRHDHAGYVLRVITRREGTP